MLLDCVAVVTMLALVGLPNSLENDSDVEFKELKKWHCYISENGETLFLNEVNILTMKGALLLLINYRRKLAKSKNVIFSFKGLFAV